MWPARYSGVYQSSVRCSFIIFKQMKRQLTSYLRSCLTSVIQREMIQAQGHTGSRKNSRSAMPTRLSATSVPRLAEHDSEAPLDVRELCRQLLPERRTALG